MARGRERGGSYDRKHTPISPWWIAPKKKHNNKEKMPRGFGGLSLKGEGIRRQIRADLGVERKSIIIVSELS